MRALIIAEAPRHRGALAASRALRGAGWDVGIGSPQPGTLAARSRSTRWHHYVPAPYLDLEGFLQSIKEAVAEVGYDVIFPSDDAETLALSFGREGFQAAIPYPPHEAVVRAFDKYELSVAGQRAGFAIPETGLATGDAVARARLPIVVKSRLHWTPGAADGPRRWRTTICSTPDEVVQRVGEIQAGGGEPLLQEVVRGRIMSLSAIVDGDGEIVACAQQLGDPLSWPPGVGSRVRSLSVSVDADLRRKAESFLRDLNWMGFAYLQFLVVDEQEPLLIDFNSYIIESFHHVIASGGNFPDMWARLAVGQRVQALGASVAGVRFQWLEGDLKRALAERRGGLARDLSGCLVNAFRAEHGLWRWNDPRPAIWYWSNLAGRMTNKLRSPAKDSSMMNHSLDRR